MIIFCAGLVLWFMRLDSFGICQQQVNILQLRREANRNIKSKPHDEIVQVSHKPFDEKVWTGLMELLSDPESIKAQLDKRVQAKKANLPPSLSTSEFDKELN